VRVGVIGLTLNTMSPTYLGKVAPGATTTDPVVAARKSLEELQGKVDLVIVLSHVREETSFEIMDKLKGVDMLVDPYIQYGNHHTWIKDEEWVSYRGETLLLRGDGQGARLGVLDIDVLAPGQKLLSEERLVRLREAEKMNRATPEEKAELQGFAGKNLFRFYRLSMEPHHGNDPDMDRLIEKWKAGADPATVARIEDPLPNKASFLTVEKCKTCHEKQFDFWRGTKHAGALATLMERGDDARFDCIGCHTLGYGQAFLDMGDIGAYANVQCESCHGTNPRHPDDPGKHPFARIQRGNCTVCHNKEAIDKDIDFARERPRVACPSEKK